SKLYNRSFGKERPVAFCVHCQQKVSNIKGKCSICGNTLPPLTRRGDSRIFRIIPETDSKSAITERLHTVDRASAKSTRRSSRSSTRVERRKPTQFIELPEKQEKLRKFLFIAVILTFGIILGMLIRFSTETKSIDGDMSTESAKTQTPESQKPLELLTIDELIPYRSLTQDEKVNLLRTFGFMPVADGRWLPKSYVEDTQHWRKRGENIDLSRLRPFELNGKRFYALVSKIDKNAYELELFDGSKVMYPAVVVFKQIEIFRKYREILHDIQPDDRDSEFYENLGDFCDNNDWFIEARNNYVLAFIENSRNLSVRKKLKFLLPGESPETEIESRIFLPEITEMPINPELPNVKLDIPSETKLSRIEKPEMLDWMRYSLPLTSADLISEEAWNMDIERTHMNNGELLYLGYWLNKRVITDWRKRLKSFRQTELESDVIVSSDEFQINNEILNTARILYQLSRNFISKEAKKLLGKKYVSSWQVFDKKFMIIVKPSNVDEIKYKWLAKKYELIFVEVDDWRKLENLIFPMLKAFCKIYIRKSGIHAVTNWVEEGIISEFAFRFLNKNRIAFQKYFVLTNAVETWRRISVDDIQNLHSRFHSDGKIISPETSDVCWGIMRIISRMELGNKLFLLKTDPDIPTKTVMFLNEYKKQVNEVLSALHYECTSLHKEICETVLLNPGNVDFLTSKCSEILAKNKSGVFKSLEIHQQQNRFSTLELWILIGLSAYLDEMQFSTQAGKEILRQKLGKIFINKPAFLQLFKEY
ncbi:MAG: hypothetical protein K8S87_03805, partial [Planctomycetes bacterium]|nr:hypothetical protein [Planctomycetota bacterium]